MNKIGRKIFYEIATGNVLVDTGERQGFVVPTTVEQDISSYKVLNERMRDTFDVIELQFGEERNNFALATSYRVNTITKQIEFDYNPNFKLEEYKSFKIEELNKKCQEDIFGGFTSSLNQHIYRTNNEDQLNFLGKFNQLINDSSIISVMWKTEDVGYIEHSREDWLKIYNEALAVKEQKLFKVNQLKLKVNNALTKEEIEAVVW